MKSKVSLRAGHHFARFSNLWQPGRRVRFDMLCTEAAGWALEDASEEFAQLKDHNMMRGTIVSVECAYAKEITNVNVRLDDGFFLEAVSVHELVPIVPAQVRF